MIRKIIRGTIVALMVLAALGTCALGVVSYWRGLPDSTLWIPIMVEKNQVQAILLRGTLHVVFLHPTRANRPVALSKTIKSLGPFYAKQVTFGNTIASGVGLPFWSICAAAMVYPSIAFITGPLRRRRRRKHNRCIHCGYSLAGLTEPRCPECGKAFTAGTQCRQELMRDKG